MQGKLQGNLQGKLQGNSQSIISLKKRYSESIKIIRKRQQITLPKKLFTKEYILRQVQDEENIKKAAVQYGYTERRLRQMLNENRG